MTREQLQEIVRFEGTGKALRAICEVLCEGFDDDAPAGDDDADVGVEVVATDDDDDLI